MTKHTKKGAGGKRDRFVKPKRFGEESTTVFGVRVPKSKETEYRLWHLEEIRPLINAKLKEFEVKK